MKKILILGAIGVIVILITVMLINSKKKAPKAEIKTEMNDIEEETIGFEEERIGLEEERIKIEKEMRELKERAKEMKEEVGVVEKHTDLQEEDRYAVQSVETVEEEKPQPIAFVQYGSGSPIKISNLQIDFRFKPYDIVNFYNPSDYPTVEYIPLQDGQNARFSLLRKVVFTKVKNEIRHFVPEEKRADFPEGSIDKDGYSQFSTYSIQVALTTQKGETVSGELKSPENSETWLIGNTAIGDYKMDLWSIQEPLSIEFENK